MTDLQIKELLYLDEQIELLETLRDGRLLNQSYIKSDYQEAINTAIRCIKERIVRVEND